MIPNLRYLSDYVSAPEEVRLIKIIDAQIWLAPFKRRVQHYGYLYDYKKRTVIEDMFLGHLPTWLGELAQQLTEDALIPEKPDQVIINEYYAGQGIAAHVDCEPCFGDTIISLSLGSACVMDFRHLHSAVSHHQLLEARSLLIMQKEARYAWTHGIAARQTDKINGITSKRGRRLSLTFRKVILDHSK